MDPEVHMKKIIIIVIILITVAAIIGFISSKDQLFPFEKDDLWGYKDWIGRIIIKPKYIIAEHFSRHGLAAVCHPIKGWFYINRNEQLIIKPYMNRNENDIDRFSDGLARYEDKGKMGFFDQQGKITIPAKFEYATRFKNGLAAVGLNVTKEYRGELEFIKAKRWGFINKKGLVIIPYRYQDLISLFDNHGRAIVIKDGNKMTIDRKGEVTELKQDQ